jgi:ABC-type glycerol-3-phosphate transport system permease component
MGRLPARPRLDAPSGDDEAVHPAAQQLEMHFLGLLNNLGGLVLFYATFNAGAVIAMIPCGIVYVSLQRYYVRGLVSGALTG